MELIVRCHMEHLARESPLLSASSRFRREQRRERTGDAQLYTLRLRVDAISVGVLGRT